MRYFTCSVLEQNCIASRENDKMGFQFPNLAANKIGVDVLWPVYTEGRKRPNSEICF